MLCYRLKISLIQITSGSTRLHIQAVIALLPAVIMNQTQREMKVRRPPQQLQVRQQLAETHQSPAGEHSDQKVQASQKMIATMKTRITNGGLMYQKANVKEVFWSIIAPATQKKSLILTTLK
jgi:FKBP-type peptidyl-prolyl cis-trans isomerase